MGKIFPPKKIYLDNSTVEDGGLGVFALENIKKDEVIEIAPALILDFTDFVDTKWNLLFEYYFWMDDFVVMPLGYGGMYNHSKKPNAQYNVSKIDRTITFTALKNIKKGEEIFFNYKGSSSEKAPLWFERK
jgi:SET domain-containing protein